MFYRITSISCYVYFQNLKKHDFLHFLTCCTHVLEHCCSSDIQLLATSGELYLVNPSILCKAIGSDIKEMALPLAMVVDLDHNIVVCLTLFMTPIIC